jgi:hypothetical protein
MGKINKLIKGGDVVYRRTEICTCRNPLENQKECLYRYFLIKSNRDIERNDNVVSVPCYGIGIESEITLNGEIVSTYDDTIDAVSSIEEKVLKLITMFRDNNVSPVHLVDIAGEYTDEWVDDFDEYADRILLLAQ